MINNEYSLIIPSETNACRKNRELNIPAFKKCGIISVVKCEGEEECAFFISITTATVSFYLRDRYIIKLNIFLSIFNFFRIKVSKFIKKDETDFYIISNKNKWANKLSIVLHSHTGDADLIVSRTHKNPNEDPNKKSKKNFCFFFH